MDKNTYETYEFLPANTNEPEPGQFFVVQDDGTFLLNRQIQYVAQVQDVKEVLEDVQPCTVYGVGVASQQFYVDVDNSAELISVSDQFILPEGDNGLYTNSYLLQPSASTTSEQMEQDVVADQYKEEIPREVDIDLATHNSKQGNDFTEITLSDEQYHTLEQKGWILLEINDKIFVLNTLGLHDITTNDKLIQKLRSEIQSETNIESDPGYMKTENDSIQFQNLVAQSFNNQQDASEFVIPNENDENLQFIITEKDPETSEFPNKNEEQMDISENNQGLELEHIKEIATIKQETLKDTSSIKIKTKFNFKDIPDKIVLGRTVNGKRLVAKVVKRNNNTAPVPVEIVPEETINERMIQNTQNSNGLSERELLSLIQQFIRSASKRKPNPEDVTSAENVIAQLLKVANIRSSLVGYNLIITKLKNNKDGLGMIYNRSVISLVTGCVKETDDEASFEHLPDLLLTVKAKAEEAMKNENELLECIDNDTDIFTVFHVHIVETKCADNVIRVSVTLNKRQLAVNQMFDVKKRHPNTVFACSACASLFKSEEALTDHQDNYCLVVDESLTIDTDKIDMKNAYSIEKTDKETFYNCTQCDAKFKKLFTCARHVKTHMGAQDTLATASKNQEISKDNGQTETAQKPVKDIFKCSMCRSTYFHPASLSKHIVARHIKVKAK
ncbi:uncharacterized protein LOC142979276 [Anticarsia gemmatalis]|uniref:uncharacterized protein LOC142979276 n=1 Tax=Anticarsia gemmatalis TaxID=129554 RepID=UPI003F7639C5